MTAFLLVSTLALAQTGTLKLTNVHTTYGELGGTRPATKYVPGDAVFVGYDIEGLTLSPSGNVQYRMTLEVFDANNKPMFEKVQPQDKVDFVPLGGNKLPARAFVTLGMDMLPGAYTMKLTVVDTASKQSQSFDHKFEITKPDFSIVRVNASIDEDGQIPAATTNAVGQIAFIQFGFVGFDRDKLPAGAKEVPQPNVKLEMIVLDEAGKPTLTESTNYKQDKDSVLKVGLNDTIIKGRFLLPMTRVGKYTVRLKATDENSKKVSTFDLPITVISPGN